MLGSRPLNDEKLIRNGFLKNVQTMVHKLKVSSSSMHAQNARGSPAGSSARRSVMLMARLKCSVRFVTGTGRKRSKDSSPVRVCKPFIGWCGSFF